MSKTTLPPHHQLIETGDGTFTLYSERFQEACHSTAGAREETLLHYIKGCSIPEKFEEHSPLVILEVGFGLGVGLMTTLEIKPAGNKLHFISLELDRDLLLWFQNEQKNHPVLKDLFWEGNLLRLDSPEVKITVIQGDARAELPRYLESHQEKWHAIYQDAFSPKKNPSLWTREWFELLKQHSEKDVRLSTYSASTSIRKSLHEAGWGVHKGEKFGVKRTSTRASLSEATDEEIILQMERSPALAITDLQLKELPLK